MHGALWKFNLSGLTRTDPAMNLLIRVSQHQHEETKQTRTTQLEKWGGGRSLILSLYLFLSIHLFFLVTLFFLCILLSFDHFACVSASIFCLYSCYFPLVSTHLFSMTCSPSISNFLSFTFSLPPHPLSSLVFFLICLIFILLQAMPEIHEIRAYLQIKWLFIIYTFLSPHY